MSLTRDDVNRIEELLELAQKNDIFWMTTREFSEFENNVLDILNDELAKWEV